MKIARCAARAQNPARYARSRSKTARAAAAQKQPRATRGARDPIKTARATRGDGPLKNPAPPLAGPDRAWSRGAKKALPVFCVKVPTGFLNGRFS